MHKSTRQNRGRTQATEVRANRDVLFRFSHLREVFSPCICFKQWRETRTRMVTGSSPSTKWLSSSLKWSSATRMDGSIRRRRRASTIRDCLWRSIPGNVDLTAPTSSAPRQTTHRELAMRTASSATDRFGGASRGFAMSFRAEPCPDQAKLDSPLFFSMRSSLSLLARPKAQEPAPELCRSV